ncbi:MAG: efflux RND transporter periplasmic adaptor subunit, partial [bacterium]|nr:efflux RND transporter periplasmic adaptor subunit [bacterium]
MLKKANIIWILVLVTALTVQWLANKYNVFDGMLYGNEETAETTVEDHQDDSGEGVAGVDYYYTCGMHPNIREEEPGICPICNMNLVKKTVSGAGSAGQVAIDPVTVQNMGVRIEEVQRRILTKNIRAYGKIEYDETLVASVSVKVEGWAEKLYVDYVGKTVRKGDPLLEIYSPELVSTQEEYLQALKYNETYKETSALTAKDHSQKLLESTRKRLKLWDISAEQLEDLEQNGKVKRELTLFSPASGIVIHKEIDEGDRILPMRHIFRVADVSRVWIHADIYENDMAWIKEGQTAKLTVPSLPGREFEGKLSFIYPYLEKGTRTVRTRFEFDNRDGALKPEMYANIMIGAGNEEPQLTVPLSSVLLTGERSVVIVDLGEGKFEPREVKIGIESDDQYAILEGLEEGERVVTSAQFL